MGTRQQYKSSNNKYTVLSNTHLMSWLYKVLIVYNTDNVK